VRTRWLAVHRWTPVSLHLTTSTPTFRALAWSRSSSRRSARAARIARFCSGLSRTSPTTFTAAGMLSAIGPRLSFFVAVCHLLAVLHFWRPSGVLSCCPMAWNSPEFYPGSDEQNRWFLGIYLKCTCSPDTSASFLTIMHYTHSLILPFINSKINR